MKVYSPSEVARLLDIKTSTLRKHSILLERSGYHIERNSKNHRFYRDQDVMTLRSVMNATKNGMTLEESVQKVISLEGDDDNRHDLHNDIVSHNDDITELKEVIHLLVKKMDEQQEHFNDKLDKQNELLLKLVDENEEMKKQIEEPKEKKSFLKRIFS